MQAKGTQVTQRPGSATGRAAVWATPFVLVGGWVHAQAGTTGFWLQLGPGRTGGHLPDPQPASFSPSQVASLTGGCEGGGEHGAWRGAQDALVPTGGACACGEGGRYCSPKTGPRHSLTE